MLDALIQELDLPPLIQLFKVSWQAQSYRVTNTMFSGALWWGGEDYTSFPVTISNIGYTEDNASDKPRLTLSNIDGHFNLVFPRLPDLKGAIVEFILTFESCTAATKGLESSLSITRHRFKVAKLASKTHSSIIYELDGVLGFGGEKLPRRQMLRDGHPKLRFAGLGYNKTGG